MLDGLAQDLSTIGTVHEKGTLSATVASDGSEHDSIAAGAAELVELRRELAATRADFKLQANVLKNVVAQVDTLETENSEGGAEPPNVFDEMSAGRVTEDLAKETEALSSERFDSRSAGDTIPVETAEELTKEVARFSTAKTLAPAEKMSRHREWTSGSDLRPVPAKPEAKKRKMSLRKAQTATPTEKKHTGSLRKSSAAKHTEKKHKVSHKARSTAEESHEDWWTAHEDAAVSSVGEVGVADSDEEVEDADSDEEVEDHHKQSRHSLEPSHDGTRLHEHTRHRAKVERITSGDKKGSSTLFVMDKDSTAESYAIGNGSRIGLQLLIGVLYFLGVVRYYPRLTPGTPIPQQAIDLQKMNPVSASLQASPKICCMSAFCAGPRAAHTFESTNVMNYWFGLLCMSCFPCCTLFLTNTCTDLNVRLGGDQMGLITGCVFSFLCSCCLIAQDAESLDLVVGAKTGFLGMDAFPEARESHHFM